MTNPEALKDPTCPYSKKTKDAINILLVIGATRSDPSQVQALIDAQSKPAKAVEDNTDYEAEIDIEKESRRLYNKIKFKMDNAAGMETNEQLQLFRTATQLLEKLLAVSEKSSNIERFEQFKQFIIDSMDRYLSATQKTEFVDYMAEVLEGK